MISYVLRSLSIPSWWIAGLVGEGVLGWPTIALFRWTCMPVTCDSFRLVGYRRAGVDAGRQLVEVLPRAEGHDHLFERCVSGPLADAVDRALDLSGATPGGGERVRHGETEVVMAVDADDDVVDPADGLPEVPDDGGVVLGTA